MRTQLALIGAAALFAAALPGCRSTQYAHILEADDPDMVGSHAAGSATWQPLVQGAVGKLLGRQCEEIQLASVQGVDARKRVAFVGIENRSAEELGDFHDQLFEEIDAAVDSSEMFHTVSRRYIEAGLRECGLVPDQLFIPANRERFQAALQRMDAPFDYLLFANVTSGTTVSNKSSQRDYRLTFELVDVATGDFDKESAEVRKGYHKSRLGKIKHY